MNKEPIIITTADLTRWLTWIVFFVTVWRASALSSPAAAAHAELVSIILLASLGIIEALREMKRRDA